MSHDEIAALALDYLHDNFEAILVSLRSDINTRRPSTPL
jgi:hypothetical protein